VAWDRNVGALEIRGEAGRGGSATVYQAFDPALSRVVALKIYHRPDKDRGLLFDEAKTTDAFAGPGVLTVHDVFPDQGSLVLEWAPFGSLRDVLAAHRAHEMDRVAAVESWFPELVIATARVHRAGWVHNDVKPGNVLLGRWGPLLSDFGTARLRGVSSPAGTIGFASPERLAGRASDPRDDVYSLGRVLEDVLLKVQRVDEPTWRQLVALCTGPDEARPLDAGALAEQLARR
jgi:serine/threonine-protein kinase